MQPTLEDVLDLLDVEYKQDLAWLVASTERLIERHGEEWVRQHAGHLLNQWKYIISLGGV